jgi:hypothetical protein
MVRKYSQELGASLPLCGLSAMLQQMLQGHHLWIGRRLGVSWSIAMTIFCTVVSSESMTIRW